MTDADTKKADPKYGSDNVPPTGKWRLIVDRAGIWELDPLGTGVVQGYTLSGNVLRSLAPIQMVPRQASGDPGEIKRLARGSLPAAASTATNRDRLARTAGR